MMMLAIYWPVAFAMWGFMFVTVLPVLLVTWLQRSIERDLERLRLSSRMHEVFVRFVVDTTRFREAMARVGVSMQQAATSATAFGRVLAKAAQSGLDSPDGDE